MNTEAIQDNTAVNSTGERLRAAREQMGLTQQDVAERLCLKLSTVRDIEEDNLPAELASTFLRGYVRSYARLVHIPEEELLPLMAKQAPARTARLESVQGFSLGKRRKKRDGWLTMFTWLILFVVVGLSGAWWWQNHKAAQAELASLTDKNSAGENQAVSPGDKHEVDHPITTMNTGTDAGTQTPAAGVAPPVTNNDVTPVTPPPVRQEAAPSGTVAAAGAASAVTAGNSGISSVNNAAPSNPVAATNGAPASVTGGLPTDNAVMDGTLPAEATALVMDFTANCWLEVIDASGKKLFSGMQRGGGKLSFSGSAPYRLKIGAPAAVQIRYQGKPVDLSQFIRNNQIARLTLGA